MHQTLNSVIVTGLELANFGAFMFYVEKIKGTKHKVSTSACFLYDLYVCRVPEVSRHKLKSKGINSQSA